MAKFSVSLRAFLGASIVSLSLLSPALGATYYVDPVNGQNSNAGTSPGAAWRNPPGTRNASNSGFISSSWGGITTSNKVKCGDVILLKGGTTQGSGQGGAWRIDGNYYTADCTGTTGEGPSSGRIVIRIASAGEWSGSNGHFALDGTGITPACSTFCGNQAGLLDVEGVDSITIAGLSASQRIVVRDSSEHGVLVANGFGPQRFRFRAKWLELANNSGAGIDVSRQTNWQVSDVISHDNRGPGFATGLTNDHDVIDGAFVDTESYNNGLGEYGGYADAYFYVGGVSLWTIRAWSHDNRQRGFDTGSTGNSKSFLYRFRDLRSWNNGKTTNPNIQRAGFGFSGDGPVGGVQSRNYVFNSIFYRNPGAGGWLGYDGGWTEVWNSVFFRNDYSGVGGNGELVYDRGADRTAVFNSIFQRRDENIWQYSQAVGAVDRVPFSNHNIYRPNSSTSEPISTFSFGGSCTPGTSQSFGGGRTFAQGLCFAGPNDKIPGSRSSCTSAGPGKGSVACTMTNTDPAFTNIGGDCDGGSFSFQACDFSLRSNSAAIDAGGFYMTATSGGTNSNTISVSADPRNYFVSPASFLEAVPDRIQIQGCGVVTIQSMTANSITFSPACSWSSGAGVHLPWSGSAPDIGALELGTTDPGGQAPAPPTLLSVDIVP